MARWRLRNAHYLNVLSYFGQKVEWQYEETDRNTGRRNRKLFEVPLHLDPNIPADHNYPELGEIIVCYEGRGESRDIIFKSEPTPDMEPLDDEAEAISASLRSKWEHPIDSLATAGTMTPGEKAFMDSMMKSFAQSSSMSVIPANSITVDKDEFEKLKAQVEALTKSTESAQRRA